MERRAVDRVASGASARSSARLSAQLDGPMVPLADGAAERPARERRARDTASSVSGRTYERVRLTKDQDTRATDDKTRRERTEKSDGTARSTIRKRAARTPSPESVDGARVAIREEQERAILEDLLYVLLGSAGSYVSLGSSKQANETTSPRYIINADLDPSLRDVTEEVLTMAQHYIAVTNFTDRHAQTEYGTINHALTASIRNHTDDYLVLVAQLENENASAPAFSLHSLALHARPMAQTLQVLFDLIQDFAPKSTDTDAPIDEYGEENMQDILNQLQMGTAFGPLSKTPKIIKGGAVLQLLTTRLRMLSGDPLSREVLKKLLMDASVPYTTMLNLWIHQGLIADEHDEFLIKEQSTFRKEKLEEDFTSEYWEKRYTMRKDDSPPQLQDVKEKILLAGKYLNVVRECSNVDVRSAMIGTALPSSFEDNGFFDNIEKAYTTANSTLLALLLNKHELQPRLASMKHFFFLSQADFFTGFSVHAAPELAKFTKQVALDKLQSLLDVSASLPGTITNHDKFKDDIRVTLSNDLLHDLLMDINNTQGLGEDALLTGAFSEPVSALDKDDSSKKAISGFQGLQLDVKVPFPISLVISRKAIFRYQLLFRHLYSLRHTEDTLNLSWIECSKTHAWRARSTSLKVERWKKRVWTLRARMLGFTTQISYYCTAEVIEPRFTQFMTKLSHVDTVDAVMQDHVDFLDTCLKECMLTNQRLLKVYAKLLKTCLAFASYIVLLSKHLEQADSALKVYGKIDEAHLATMDEKLSNYEQHFERTLKVLLDTLNYYAGTETISLLSLMMRLDWNKGFRDDVLDP
ncbi:Spc98 family-domain-containing protein [Protomyces lactucae-debilis]|uniref:Spindle pole body component n=1 Tax=Protomyces lactucae-debilis TaxID=2754530 RepID=A0A1Y2F1G7_PROLT|nr:Spc98 family-domain-containing protein [Protomyces lactucae-debilis]ORY77709.1 Spc98 family-domain-containing protein [Protomyces lactucae-debilis]